MVMSCILLPQLYLTDCTGELTADGVETKDLKFFDLKELPDNITEEYIDYINEIHQNMGIHTKFQKTGHSSNQNKFYLVLCNVPLKRRGDNSWVILQVMEQAEDLH
jgi:hypothetical protein